jgi:mRNA interferase YafQ
MLRQVVAGKFEQDYKCAKKQGKDMGLLHDAMDIILHQESLPPAYRDHALTGSYEGWRECHVEPDWLLVYRTTKDKAIFARISTHAELFG